MEGLQKKNERERTYQRSTAVESRSSSVSRWCPLFADDPAAVAVAAEPAWLRRGPPPGGGTESRWKRDRSRVQRIRRTPRVRDRDYLWTNAPTTNGRRARYALLARFSRARHHGSPRERRKLASHARPSPARPIVTGDRDGRGL